MEIKKINVIGENIEDCGFNVSRRGGRAFLLIDWELAFHHIYSQTFVSTNFVEY